MAKLTKSVNRATAKLLEKRARPAPGHLDISLPRLESARSADFLMAPVTQSSSALQMRLKQLARASAGKKRLRAAMAKREKARRRQQRHTWRLRATCGDNSVLEELAMGSTTSGDFRRRLLNFWGFLDRHELPHGTDRQLDLAATEWADAELLSGEASRQGKNYWRH